MWKVQHFVEAAKQRVYSIFPCYESDIVIDKPYYYADEDIHALNLLQVIQY